MKNYSAIVVTGAAGWFGRALVDALLRGLPDCPDLEKPPFSDLPLRLFDIEPPPAVDDARVSITQGDIRDAAACRRLFEGIEKNALVLHCAGVIHPRAVAQFDAVNVEGAKNLFAAAGAAGAARAVVLSSNSPCGCNPSREHRFVEESPYNPYMGYGRSKMKMERFVREQVAPEWTIVRAPWFYGPGQPPRQTLFFSMIKDGKGPIVGDGENLRSMAFVGNLAQGVLRAAQSEKAAGEIYWIADAEPYTTNQIIDTVERLLEEEFEIRCRRGRLRLPGVAAEIALCCDWILQSAGIYAQKIHVLSEMNKTIACDIDKARRDLGYAPAIALEEGMRRSIADILARGVAL